MVFIERREVLSDLAERVDARRDRDAVYGLTKTLTKTDWGVAIPCGHINLFAFVSGAAARTRQVDEADRLVTVDAGVMGGAPVFAGTRVPVDIVAGSLVGGVTRCPDIFERRELVAHASGHHRRHVHWRWTATKL